jgi:hypothetical protein
LAYPILSNAAMTLSALRWPESAGDSPAVFREFSQKKPKKTLDFQFESS